MLPIYYYSVSNILGYIAIIGFTEVCIVVIRITIDIILTDIWNGI